MSSDRRSTNKTVTNQITKVGGAIQQQQQPFGAQQQNPSALPRDPLHVNEHVQVE